MNKYRIVNIEMQVLDEGDWPERSVVYLCRCYDTELEEVRKETAELKKEASKAKKENERLRALLAANGIDPDSGI